MRILQTIDLKKYYGTEPNITRALDGVNFSVNDGEFVAVVGTDSIHVSFMAPSVILPTYLCLQVFLQNFQSLSSTPGILHLTRCGNRGLYNLLCIHKWHALPSMRIRL